MNSNQGVRYLESHEWARKETDGTITVGITEYAQDQLGDVVFVELPEVGRQVEKGEQVAVVESVKTASDIYTPVSGEITEVNGALEDAPENINDAPFEAGWMFRVRPSDASEYDDLLDADGYQAVIEGA